MPMSLPYSTRLAAILAGFMIMISAGTATAQISLGSDGGKSIQIPRLNENPRIDGVLDDPVWSRALLIDDFHQYEPVEYAEPSQKSEIRIFYTDDALYIAHHFHEDNPDLISANILRQGQSLQSDDILAVILDPYLDRRNGYRFEVNANGVRWEGLFQNISEVEGSWDGIWQADASRDETGWYGEMRIPFQTISFNPDSDAWGINFSRSIRRSNENIAWVSRNRQVNPGIAGTMTGMQGLQQGAGLDIVPSIVMRQERVIAPLGSSDISFEPQVDLFYKITPQLNAALTVNTDFSATEVDSRQVNLTRFNLFFPEKRDFFIRDSDIFEFGQIGGGGFDSGRGSGNTAIPSSASQNARPFFSRRIGLSTSGSPVDINAGVKVSGRVGDWNVGSLIVSQAEDQATGVKAKDVFVGRAILNVLSESQLGVIATSGDPQSNTDNSVVGMDFRYRNSRLPGGKTVQGVFFYQQSDTDGKSGDDASWGFGISSPNNQGWRGGYEYKRVEKNFDPAVGFVSLTDMEDHALDFGYRHFFSPGSYIRSTFVGFEGYESRDLGDNDVISSNKGIRLSNNNNSGDVVFVRLMKSREVIRNAFTINRSSDGKRSVVVPRGDYAFDEYQVGLQLGNQRKVSGLLSSRFGDYYDGTQFQRNARLNWRPTRQYDIGISYTETDIELPAGDFTVRLFALDTKLAFSSTISWSNLLQYDNVSEVMGFNSRLHWIPEAGRQAFLVFNYGLEDFDKDNDFHSTVSDISLKFSYTFRF
jgi:hypothetical protein